MPGDTLRAKVTLYDPNDKAIDGLRVNVKIFDTDEKLMAERDIESMNYFEFKIEPKQIPGAYTILSSFENIKEQNTFVVGELRKITMNQEGHFVYIENVGNVEYKDEVTIILESENKKYLINKKIKLEPGEKITIDLSKEVQSGVYDITLPEEAGEDKIEGVPIEDNRAVIKKTADGLSVVTGAVVNTAGYIISRPLLATVILVLIVLGTVAYYSRDFIINKIKRKKTDGTENLFEDFKFEKEK